MLSHFHLYGEQRSSGVMGRRNGQSGLRDDDDVQVTVIDVDGVFDFTCFSKRFPSIYFLFVIFTRCN